MLSRIMLSRRLYLSRLALKDPQRIYHQQRSRSYWIKRDRIQRAKFWIGKNIYRARRWARSRRDSASIFAVILRSVAGQLILAVALVAGFEILERALIPWLADLGVSAGLPGLGTVQTWGDAFERLRMNRSVYADLLLVMVQVAGVFLGLYFTAVGVVVSTIYARVHGDVRALLVREKVGNLYIRTVALLGVTATIILAIQALGYSPGVLNLAIVSLLGVLLVPSFVILGYRVFDFFDPVRLTDYIGQDLAREIVAVTPDGIRWQDLSFQHHHQRRAEDLLKTYENVVYLATQEDNVRGQALKELASNALSLLLFYAQHKPRIPSDSRWYKRTLRHKDWLMSDYIDLEAALNTSTVLRPEELPDHSWFEAQIEEMLSRIVRLLLEREDLRNAAEIYNDIRRTCQVLGESLLLDEALSLFRSVEDATSAHVREATLGSAISTDETESLSLVLSLLEIQGVALINILLGVSQRLRNTTADSFGALVSQIDWKQPVKLYAGEIPRPVVENLEKLQLGLEIERAVEGEFISPPWYREQLAALGFVRLLPETANKLVAELEGAFADEAESLLAQDRHLLAAQVIARGLEACHKFVVHLEDFKACYDRLGELRRVEDIPWPPLELHELADRVDKVEKRLVYAFAECLPALANVPRSEDLPDYFGHAYTILFQQTYYALVKGDEEAFAKLFPTFFWACFTAAERLREQSPDPEQTAAAIFSTEPLADLVELSGHAIIYGELDSIGYWRGVKSLWDKYFSNYAEPVTIFNALSKAADRSGQAFLAFAPRTMVRSSLQQDLWRHLKERGLVDEFAGYYPPRNEGVDRHGSQLIRVLARGSYMMFYDPQDVFFVVYARSRPEFSGVELTSQASTLAKQLSNEPDVGSQEEDTDKPEQ